MSEKTNPTTQQQQAIDHLNGPCLVLAGAGTGKTRVITERIVSLIENHDVAPESIVALTFTEKAAGEMQNRLDELLPYGVFGVTTSTFHGFCNELLRRHSYLVGIDPNARLVGGAEQVSLLRRHYHELPLDYLKPPYNPVHFLTELTKFIEKAKEERISPEDITKWAMKQDGDEAGEELTIRHTELAACYAKAVEIFNQNHVLTYADLLVKTLELLQMSALTLKEEREKYQYLLIDEFQDTNSVQAEIAYALAGENGNIFVVGDDDQSIYRFRGANITNIMAFRERYPDAPLITLTENFRSGQPILDAAYSLIQHNNPHRLEVQAMVNKRLTANQPYTEPVRYQRYSTGLHEAEAVAMQIKEMVDGGLDPARIAILAHSHAQLDQFEQELENLAVPVNRVKRATFYTQPSVEAALSFLNFLANPNGNENIFYLLAGAPFDIPINELREANILARRQSISLWEQLNAADIQAPELVEAKNYLGAQLLELGKSTPSSALRDHVIASGWQKQLVTEEHRLAANHLNTLYYEAKNYETLHRPVVLAQFLQYVDDLRESGEDVLVEAEQSEEADGVTLMTVHGSKGLEFRVVFLVSFVQRRFPKDEFGERMPIPVELLNAPTDNVKYEEERRLAYVAFTRAEEKLIITGAKRYGSNKMESKPSVFVQEALGITEEPTVSDQDIRGGLAQPVPKKKASVLPPFPTTITASALESFEDNPAEYERQHIFRLLPDPDTSPASDVGTCVHAVLRSYFTALRDNVPFDLEKAFEMHWVGTGFENSKSRDEACAKHLGAVKRHLERLPAGFVPLEVESSVQFRVPSENVTVIGKIDRIDQLPDGSLAVIDYKTGSKDATKADVRKNLPLSIYAAALEQQGKRVEEVSLYYLQRGEATTVLLDAAYRRRTEERVIQTIQALKQAYKDNSFPEKKFFG